MNTPDICDIRGTRERRDKSARLSVEVSNQERASYQSEFPESTVVTARVVDRAGSNAFSRPESGTKFV